MRRIFCFAPIVVSLLATLGIAQAEPVKGPACAIGASPSQVTLSGRSSESISRLPQSTSGGGPVRGKSTCSVAAKALLADRSVALIDVRPPALTGIVWIPGAARLSVTQLTGNLLVKSSRTAVLIGNGKDTFALRQQCQKLHEAGLTQIRVLEGGIPAWHHAGGVTVGATGSLDRPLVLEPGEVDQIIHDDKATLLFVGTKPSSAWRASKARLLQASKAELPNVILQRVANSKKGNVTVIVLRGGDDPDRWRNAARALALAEPFFFIGEASRYDAYLEEQASIAANANKPRETACGRG